MSTIAKNAGTKTSCCSGKEIALCALTLRRWMRKRRRPPLGPLGRPLKAVTWFNSWHSGP